MNEIEFWIKLLGAIGGLFLFFRGYMEYRKSNRIKRAEFLEKMISEFNAPERKLAMEILDDYGHSGREGYYIPDLKRVLRNHQDQSSEIINSTDEVAVRKSFDSLLDYFTRLSYYVQNDLMSQRELIYFRYYLDKIQRKPEVRAYISYYFYTSDFEELFRRLPSSK